MERLHQKVNSAPGVAVLLLIWAVSTSQPRNLGITGPKSCFSHSQWVKKTLLQKLLVGHSADDFNDACSDVHALVAILIFITRLPLKRPRHGTERAVLEWSAVRACHLLKLRHSGQATGMAQQISDRHGSNQTLQQSVILILFFHHHPFRQLWNVIGDGIIQGNFAFIHQHHNGCADEHLGHGSDPKHIVFADRLLRLDISIAEEVFVMNLPGLVGNNGYDTRQLVAV